MASQLAYYRKYRPAAFEDIIGQSAITTSLSNAVEKKDFSHAYLFTGPRGVGKTSAARILAHAVNQLDYQPNAQNHLDIIEIDGASNRKVEEIENLREKVQIAPTEAKFKVYIIDEVHMLTTHAFNALLKTLEEPPEHVIFILATTEMHKLPPTIVSRTQRYSFRHLSTNDLVALLQSVCTEEGIETDEESLHVIASSADGAVRDALSILEQLALQHNKKLQASTIRDDLGLASRDLLDELTTAIASGDSARLFEALEKQYSLGSTPVALSLQLADFWRSQLLEKSPNPWQLEGIHKLIEVAESKYPELKFEATLIELLQPTDESSPIVKKQSPVEMSPPRTESKSDDDSQSQTARDKAPTSKTSSPPQTPSNQDGQLAADSDWDKVLETLKSTNTTLYAVLRMADAAIENGSLKLVFEFPFHQKRIDIQDSQTAIHTAFAKNSLRIEDIKTSTKKTSDKSTAKPDKILDILGGEVVEV